MILNMLKIYRWNNHMYLQSVTKNMVKTATWTISCFYHLSSLSNVENKLSKTCIKLRYGCVKPCYAFATLHRERGGIFKHAFEHSHIILSRFVWDLQKNKQKTKQRWGSMHAVSDNLNLLYWVWLCHTTHYHEHNDRKWRQTDA